MATVTERSAPPKPVVESPPVALQRTGPFSADETTGFHAEDKHAAAAVACIMTAILSAGLLAYIFIAWWVFTWPM